VACAEGLRKKLRKHHGDNEEDPRNLELRDEDFDLIPTILAEPDRIEISRSGGGGSAPTVEFHKRLDDGFVAVVEVRTKRGELTVKSFQRRRGDDGGNSPAERSGGPAGSPSPEGAGPVRPTKPAEGARSTPPERPRKTATEDNGDVASADQAPAARNDGEAPDDVPDTIDHPTAARESEAAEALARPETDHVGRAVERARQRREARETPALPEGFEHADPADPKAVSAWVRRGRRTLALNTFYKVRQRGGKGGASESLDPDRDAATRGTRPKPQSARSSTDDGDAAGGDQARSRENAP